MLILTRKKPEVVSKIFDRAAKDEGNKDESEKKDRDYLQEFVSKGDFESEFSSSKPARYITFSWNNKNNFYNRHPSGIRRLAVCRGAWINISRWPARDCHVPLYVDMKGIDNCTERALPRLEVHPKTIISSLTFFLQYDPKGQRKPMHVAVFLIHGVTQFILYCTLK